MENTIDWEHIRVAFAEPFNPADVDFRVQGKASESTGKAQVVCFVDARTVQDRLDSVVGPGAWAFDYTPLMVDAKGVVLSAKGTLTIHGVSKSDVGDASNFEQSKGTVSDCFKRSAVQWGIGRYLYAVPSAWVAADKSGKIAPDVLRDLRAKLPRPASAQPAAQAAPVTQAAQPAPAAQPTKPATEAASQTTDANGKRASQTRQRQVAESLRKQGYDTATNVQQYLASVLGRVVNVLALKNGIADVTVAECAEIETALTQPEATA